MGDVILFRSREKLNAERAAKVTPPLAEWAKKLDFTDLEERVLANQSELTALYLECDEADVDPGQVMEIMQHDGCTLEAAIMAAGAKKRAGY